MSCGYPGEVVIMTMPYDLCFIRSIATRLCCSGSTISRELKRTGGAGVYDANLAHLECRAPAHCAAARACGQRLVPACASSLCGVSWACSGSRSKLRANSWPCSPIILKNLCLTKPSTTPYMDQPAPLAPIGPTAESVRIDPKAIFAVYDTRRSKNGQSG